MMVCFVGKVVLIMGIGGGQGCVVVLCFVCEGVIVVGCDFNVVVYEEIVVLLWM